jgi:hypothetical protein
MISSFGLFQEESVRDSALYLKEKEGFAAKGNCFANNYTKTNATQPAVTDWACSRPTAIRLAYRLHWEFVRS